MLLNLFFDTWMRQWMVSQLLVEYSSGSLDFGVSQGSALGPILFFLYTLPQIIGTFLRSITTTQMIFIYPHKLPKLNYLTTLQTNSLLYMSSFWKFASSIRLNPLISLIDFKVLITFWSWEYTYIFFCVCNVRVSDSILPPVLHPLKCGEIKSHSWKIKSMDSMYLIS